MRGYQRSVLHFFRTCDMFYKSDITFGSAEMNKDYKKWRATLSIMRNYRGYK